MLSHNPGAGVSSAEAMAAMAAMRLRSFERRAQEYIRNRTPFFTKPRILGCGPLGWEQLGKQHCC